MSVVDFPADEMRKTQLFRAWKAAREAGHPDAEAIWAVYMSTFVPVGQREMSRELLREVSGG